MKFGTLGGIRTHTVQFLRLMTLPVGLPGHGTGEGNRTPNITLMRGAFYH